MRSGGTPTVDDASMWDEGGLPWVSIADISKASPIVHTDRRVSSLGVAAKALPAGEPGTLLFAMYASVGAMGVLGVEASWNQAILGIAPLQGLADSRFVRYWLEYLKPTLIAITRSNTQDNLNAEQVGNAPFPILPLGTQRAVADYLDRETTRIDALVAAKRQMITLLEARFKTRVTELIFGDPHRHAAPLGRLGTCLAGFAFPSQHFLHDEAGGIPLLRGINVSPGRVRWDDAVYWPRERVDPRIAGYTLEAGDLVIGMDRPIVQAGVRVAAVDQSDLPALLVQRVARIRANALVSTSSASSMNSRFTISRMTSRGVKCSPAVSLESSENLRMSSSYR